jgi:hypothetical protein
MKLEKRMWFYISLAVFVGLFAAFNREDGSIFSGFMVLSFAIITVTVRSALQYVRRMLEILEEPLRIEPSRTTPSASNIAKRDTHVAPS